MFLIKAIKFHFTGGASHFPAEENFRVNRAPDLQKNSKKSLLQECTFLKRV